jgi:hypothetical protein
MIFDRFHVRCLCGVVTTNPIACHIGGKPPPSPVGADVEQTLFEELFFFFSDSDDKHEKHSDVKLCVQSEAASTTSEDFFLEFAC